MLHTETISRARVGIRWMIRRDMADVVWIENATSNHPWSEADFCRELRRRNVIGMVAECDDQIVGFMVYELRKRSIKILAFAVQPQSSRRGVGSQLIGKLVSKLSPERRSTLSLFVRETNLACQLFLRNLGFLATHVDRGHYDDTGEDGYQMEYSLELATIATQEVLSDAN